ncbi:c-type cytochrome [Marivita hallyeonensis]|nr:cytochrome c family protein [Marivita hallyeonensis]
MTFTKIVGSFCGALLIFLLGKWAAETLYHVGGDHGEAVAVYVIEVDDGEPAEEVVEMSFEEMFAAADAGRGERQWGKCRACHAIDEERNGTGPHLVGLVGREVGAVGDYNYSSALAGVDGDVWTVEKLNDWLINPSDVYPGTSMNYRLTDQEDRLDLLAYLDSLAN